MASLILRIKEMCAEWLEPFKPNASYSIQKNMKIAMGDFFMSSGYCTELVNLFAKDRINQTARPITKQTNEEVFEACKQEKKTKISYAMKISMDFILLS